MLLRRLTSKFEGQTALRKNVIVLFLGTVLGQALPLLASPILTRLFTPGQFGTLGVFSAISMSLIPMATLRYEFALLLARSEEEVADAIASIATTILAATLIAFALVAVLPFDRLFQDTGFEQLKFLLPIALLCISVYQLLVYEATRQARFEPVARTKLVQGAAAPGTQIALGLAGAGSLGLVIGFLVGQAAGSLLLTRRLILPQLAAIRAVTRERIVAFLRRHVRFPLLSSWSGMLQEAGNNYLAIVLVTILYGPHIGGFLFLADRIVGRPLLIVTTSMLQASASEFSVMVGNRVGDIERHFKRVVGVQFLMAIAWCGAVALLMPFVVTPLFGESWTAAIPYIQLACIAYVFQASMHPVSPMLQILERQDLIAIFEVFRAAVLVLSLVLPAAWGYDALVALSAYVIAQSLAQMVFYRLQVLVIRGTRHDKGSAPPSRDGDAAASLGIADMVGRPDQ